MKLKFRLLHLIVSIFLILFLFQSISAKEIYVSPKGNDKNMGTMEQPIATVVQARKLAIENLKSGITNEVSIWLDDGIYQIFEPLVFEPLNDEENKSKISFKAVGSTEPIISGGVQLLGWKKNKNGLWETQLPEMLNKIKGVRELFVDDERAIRARFPNDDYLRVKKVGEDRRTNFYFEEGDFPIPENQNEMELILFHDWSVSRIGINEISKAEKKLTAVDSIGARTPVFFNLDNWEPNPRYFLENAIEFIDSDYEWFYDSKKSKIYLQLPELKNPELMQIFVPVAEELISIIGNENQLLDNIHFEGISFKHCKWEIPETGYAGIQACHFDPGKNSVGWEVVPAAISVSWSENISFRNCNFQNLGGSGIWFGTGCKNCIISNSGFYDISGNGIMIGEGRDRELNGEKWWKVSPEQVALANTIENCRITSCGEQFFGAVGIWCGLTAETTIRNNEISELPYTGISIGWMWSPEPTPCRQNVVVGNHIHHIMKILSDGGGIYMLGLQPGSKLTNNHIHDVEINAGRAESNGMFLDEGTTNVVVANNLIYNIAKSPLRFHRATKNLVQNNYLFCIGENPPIRYNATNEADIEKIDNKVFSTTDANYSTELKMIISKWIN